MEELVSTLKALADRNRLRIVAALLQHEELCACQIIELLDVAGATASNHLGLLQKAGIVSGQKHGRWVFFRLTESFQQDFPLSWLADNLLTGWDYERDAGRLAEILRQNPTNLCKKQREKGFPV